MNSPKESNRTEVIAVIGVIWGLLIVGYMLFQGGPRGTDYYLLGEWHGLAIGILMIFSGFATINEWEGPAEPWREKPLLHQLGLASLVLLVAADVAFIAWMVNSRAEVKARRVQFHTLQLMLSNSNSAGMQPDWHKRFIGEDVAGYADAAGFHGRSIVDGHIPLITKLPRVKFISFRDSGITDSGLAVLADMSQLERLNLDRTEVTDAGIAHLRKLTNLKLLSLEDTKVTQIGLQQLSDLKDLKIEYRQSPYWLRW